MARAANDSDTSLISLNIEHLNNSDMYSSTDVTPVPNSDSDNEMFAAEDADDVDEHNEERIFSDSDEDTFYYFEDDSSWAEAYEDYEEDVILDPEDSILVHNESWLSTGSGGGGSGGGGGAHSEYNPSDSDVQIIDDVIVVD